MKDKTETGTVAQPAETTTRKDGAAASQAEITLTADGIAGLLKSEFATATPEAAAGEEVQPAATETANTQTTEETTGTEETQTETAEETAEETTGTVPQTPVALQDAIREWEEQGGGELPAELQTLVEKRIGKLTAQRETEKTLREAAEAEAKEAKAEAARLRSRTATPQFIDEKALDEKEKNLDWFKGRVELYLEEAANDEERAWVEQYMETNKLDLMALKRQKVLAGEKLSKEIPKQRKSLAEYRKVESEVEPTVKEYFPWMDDKASPEFQLAQGVRDAFPLETVTPKYRLALGIHVLGLQELQKRMAAKAGKNGTAAKRPAVKPPPKSPGSGSAAPAAVRNGRAAAEETVRQRFQQAPTRESVTELLKIGLRS